MAEEAGAGQEQQGSEQPVGNEQQGLQETQGQGQEQPGQEGKEGQQQEGQPQGNPDLAGYTDFTLPEGVEPDVELQKSFAGVAKEMGLTQENAQKLVTLQSEHLLTVERAKQEAYEKVQKEWVEEIKADKEFGGEKFESRESINIANRPIKQYGTPELNKILEESGLGNNPHLFRLMYKIGLAMGEDSSINSDQGGQEKKSVASKLYPSMKA